jgi:hypothetical protein
VTLRQHIKLKILIDARRTPPKNKDAFKRSALGVFDCLDPTLMKELDRIETIPLGITKLISEAWNEFQREQLEEETFKRWKIT